MLVPVPVINIQYPDSLWLLVYSFESNLFRNYQKLWTDNDKRQLALPGIALLSINSYTKLATIVTNIQLQKKKLTTSKRQRIFIRKTKTEQIFRGLHHRMRFFIGLRGEDLQSVCKRTTEIFTRVSVRNFDFWCTPFVAVLLENSYVRFRETFDLNGNSNMLRPIISQYLSNTFDEICSRVFLKQSLGNFQSNLHSNRSD